MALLFFFNDTATTEIYTLSLHDALPICQGANRRVQTSAFRTKHFAPSTNKWSGFSSGLNAIRSGSKMLRSKCRSEEHTSELQSRLHLVCRLLLEEKNHIGATANDISNVV